MMVEEIYILCVFELFWRFIFLTRNLDLEIMDIQN